MVDHSNSADHYSTLGVAPSATAADLRTAYLKLARANHPDQFGDTDRSRAEARMQQINEAWNVLGVKHKRREYDANRPTSSTAGPRETTGASKARRGHAHFRPFDDDPVQRADIDYDTTPIAGSRALPKWAAFVPVLLVASGIVTLGFGTMVAAGGVFALGLILVGLGAVSFLMMPLIVMARADRDPDL